MLHEELNEKTAGIRALMSNVVGAVPAIANADDFEAVAMRLQVIKSIAKQADATQKEFTVPLDHQRKAIIAWFREQITDALDEAERAAKAAVAAWHTEQDRKRREEAMRAEEAARKERERLARLAAKAEQRGDDRKAERYATQAESVVAAPASAPAPKADGVSFREVWEFEITDPALLPREYLMPDDKKIGGVVRALKGDTNIPGVKVTSRKVVAART